MILKFAHVRSLCTRTSRANISNSPVTMRISVTGSSVLKLKDSIAAKVMSILTFFNLDVMYF